MKAAVLGQPIAHSLSPALHRAAYAALGLDGWSYEAIECDEAGLPGLLASCGPGWAGLSLTMPLKRAVLPLLGWIDPVAVATGGANTVVFTQQASRGYNTDVAGLVTALTEAGVKPRAATILGAGATACSALAALRELGLAEVTAAVRDPARATGLLAAASRLGVRVRLAPFERKNNPERDLFTSTVPGRGGDFSAHETDLLISTVPEGGSDFFTERMRRTTQPPAAVMDVVYHPWPTPLAQAARRAGSAVISGYELLLHQAARQVELMTGLAAPVPRMREAGLAELASRALCESRVTQIYLPGSVAGTGPITRAGPVSFIALRKFTCLVLSPEPARSLAQALRACTRDADLHDARPGLHSRCGFA